MGKIIEYLKETRAELKYVIWPNRRQTLFYTILVIILSVVLAYYMGAFDFIFSKGLEQVL